ncbi:uncharacterized protein EI90DRAFT_3072510 [Cantharellus anzutake]|uniref:uncharacterized protein n=1 Tax=Cantharellus anzutake TaxID=1750568 RepID=UPI001903C3C6|nr:uncharacterized protein EI90DRAFT_3072510 [Cantharellus anzutake]KAF8325562.1 hypothetical protein EI90DRAFT_3072510 [Cantharellus anzutake]
MTLLMLRPRSPASIAMDLNLQHCPRFHPRRPFLCHPTKVPPQRLNPISPLQSWRQYAYLPTTMRQRHRRLARHHPSCPPPNCLRHSQCHSFAHHLSCSPVTVTQTTMNIPH